MRPRRTHHPRILFLLPLLALLAPLAGCANQTTFHTTPLGASVFINGELCGQSPCIYNTRYGFPTRIRVQIYKPGFEPRELFLDSEPPIASYLLFGFGSYLFHTFPEEYRFALKSQAVQAPVSTHNPATR